MYEVECPYCGKNIDPPRECYEPEIKYRHQCSHCEKHFVFQVDYFTVYSEYKADCLNGVEHEYKPTLAYPTQYTKMQCQDCGDIRPCTEEEMTRIMENKGEIK